MQPAQRPGVSDDVVRCVSHGGSTLPQEHRYSSAMAVMIVARGVVMRMRGASLAVNPSGVAADVVLLLPDGHAMLHFIDDEAAGLEGFVAMRGCDAYPDGDVAQLQVADAVHAQRLRHAESLGSLGHDALAFANTQRLEGLVFQMPDFLTFVVVAYPAFETGEAATMRIEQFRAQCAAVDRGGDETEAAHPPATGGMNTTWS